MLKIYQIFQILTIFDAILSGIANLVQLFSQNTLHLIFYISSFCEKRISFYGFCVEAKQCNREFLNRLEDNDFSPLLRLVRIV